MIPVVLKVLSGFGAMDLHLSQKNTTEQTVTEGFLFVHLALTSENNVILSWNRLLAKMFWKNSMGISLKVAGLLVDFVLLAAAFSWSLNSFSHDPFFHSVDEALTLPPFFLTSINPNSTRGTEVILKENKSMTFCKNSNWICLVFLGQKMRKEKWGSRGDVALFDWSGTRNIDQVCSAGFYGKFNTQVDCNLCLLKVAVSSQIKKQTIITWGQITDVLSRVPCPAG